MSAFIKEFIQARRGNARENTARIWLSSGASFGSPWVNYLMHAGPGTYFGIQMHLRVYPRVVPRITLLVQASIPKRYSFTLGKLSCKLYLNLFWDRHASMSARHTEHTRKYSFRFLYRGHYPFSRGKLWCVPAQFIQAFYLTFVLQMTKNSETLDALDLLEIAYALFVSILCFSAHSLNGVLSRTHLASLLYTLLHPESQLTDDRWLMDGEEHRVDGIVWKGICSYHSRCDWRKACTVRLATNDNISDFTNDPSPHKCNPGFRMQLAICI